MREVFVLDWDWRPPKTWLDNYRTKHVPAVLAAFNLKPVEIIIHPSSSKRGVHLWIHADSPKPLSDQEKVMLQWMLLDDLSRTRINYLRVRRGLRKFFNKAFTTSRTLKKPRCERCALIKALKEAEAARLKLEEEEPCCT